MKKITLFVAFALLVGACKKDDNTTPTQTKDELIKANGWKLDRIVDLSGNTIATSKLNTSTALIFALDIQFKESNIVRASDKVTKQVINAGTWAFTDSETAVDIKVTGFTGKFAVVELSKSKLSLRNKVPVSGVDTDCNMEFSPNL